MAQFSGSLITNALFREKIGSSTDKDFKKIIDATIADKNFSSNDDTQFIFETMNAKCCMDFYEDMNREVSHD